MDPVRYINYVN